MPHPDVALERARLRFAQECLEEMRRRTAARVADEDVLAANEADAEAVKWQLERRLDSLNDDAGSLCFGRIDDEAEERWYIGRRHVEDGTGVPVVVDWRAGVATPFYRATLADPLGLHLRRRFVFTGRELTDVFEEDFDDPDSLAGSGGVPDPLLAELGRARTGRCATSSRRSRPSRTRSSAPLETCLVVQGGPGTGKTAVGLHRRVPALRAPRPAGAVACSWSARTRCSCATSARCCRRSARRRRRRRPSTACSRSDSEWWPKTPMPRLRSRATPAW